MKNQWNSWKQVSASGYSPSVAGILATTLLVGTGGAYDIHRSKEWIFYVQSKSNYVIDVESNSDVSNVELDLRTIAERIENIRKILNPSMTELAKLLGVSRQAVYKWISEESSPDSDKTKLISQFNHMADLVKNSKLARPELFLKVRLPSGVPLIDALISKDVSVPQIQHLISELKERDQSYFKSGIEQLKGNLGTEWRATISVPGGFEDGL